MIGSILSEVVKTCRILDLFMLLNMGSGKMEIKRILFKNKLQLNIN